MGKVREMMAMAEDGDFLNQDLGDADVVTCFLLQSIKKG